MVSDLDIWRSANLYVQQHGENAALEAGMMADKMLDDGNLEGRRTWHRILTAIEWLQNEEGRHPFKVEH